MLAMSVGLTFAAEWTVKMETSIHTKWVDANSGRSIDKGGAEGPTRTLTVTADTKAEAMKKAKSMCYDACDGSWTATGVTQEGDRTYRVYKKVVLTNYYVVE